jgi:NarL family two-component system response regulator LiaR
MIRRGFAAYLVDTGRFNVTGEAGSLEEAVFILNNSKFRPICLFWIYNWGVENSLELLGYLKKKYSDNDTEAPAVLVYSIFEYPFRIQSAMHLGACRYIFKSADEEEIANALETILSGRIYLDTQLTEKLSGIPDMYAEFTTRERIILELLQKNYGNSQNSTATFPGVAYCGRLPYPNLYQNRRCK